MAITNFVQNSVDIISSRMGIVKTNAEKLYNDVRLTSKIKKIMYKDRVDNVAFDKVVVKHIYDKYNAMLQSNNKEYISKVKSRCNYMHNYMNDVRDSYIKLSAESTNDELKKYYDEQACVVEKDINIISTLENFYVNTYNRDKK